MAQTSTLPRPSASYLSPSRPSAPRWPCTLLTIANVAERCSVSERTIRRWIQAGDLHAHQFGSHLVRVSEADLAAFLAASRVA
jgi:excisionase family DNA binding protein